MFEPFPKIPRWSREIIVTEKIDGTNAAIVIADARVSEHEWPKALGQTWFVEHDGIPYAMWAQSRKQIIAPAALSGALASDNFGFAAWAYEHRDELVKLGPGRHFGEWWGQGIQRNYGLKERRWSLFNVSRWAQQNALLIDGDPRLPAPACCYVVPRLTSGIMGRAAVERAMDLLRRNGSYAAKGFDKPEGVIIFHTAGGGLFKRTFDKDQEGKGSE